MGYKHEVIVHSVRKIESTDVWQMCCRVLYYRACLSQMCNFSEIIFENVKQYIRYQYRKQLDIDDKGPCLGTRM